MDGKEILKRLSDDAEYYGEFGKRFLSNSDIKTLLSNPMELGKDTEKTVNLITGSYFHTLLLQPDKLHSFKILDYANRNYKAYKEDVASHGEICLLQHEADKIHLMSDKLLSNKIVSDLILGTGEHSRIEREVPGIKEFYGNMWKGKADIVNHDEGLVIDLKTTSDIDKFHWSVRDYNYDSQAYIYSSMFGYDFIFIVIDKNSFKMNIFEVSEQTLINGEDKLRKANDIYDLYYKTDGFNPNDYIETKIV
jgi:hypothetical protein